MRIRHGLVRAQFDQSNELTIEITRGFLKRGKGLLGRTELEPRRGLLIPNCSSVHTFGMRFSLDLVFLSQDHRVVSIRESLKPWRAAIQWDAKMVLEMAAGEVQREGIRVGQVLRIRY
jgi:uncharacterized protein